MMKNKQFEISCREHKRWFRDSVYVLQIRYYMSRSKLPSRHFHNEPPISGNYWTGWRDCTPEDLITIGPTIDKINKDQQI